MRTIREGDMAGKVLVTREWFDTICDLFGKAHDCMKGMIAGEPPDDLDEAILADIWEFMARNEPALELVSDDKPDTSLCPF